MDLTRAIAIGVIAASLGLAASVHAQSLKNVDTPSEFPPASYKGKQYVDSKGCVYIRAGVDGATTWVPRMTRDRKVICGYKPTNPDAAPTTASATKLDKNVVYIEPAAPPTATAAAKPKPKATTTTTAAAAPKPKPKPKPATTATTTTAATTATTTTTTKPKTTKTPWWAKPPTTKTTTTTTTTAAPKAKPKTTTTTAAAPTTTTTTSTTKTRRTLDQTQRQTGFDAPCRDGVKTSRTVRCGPQSELPYTPGTGKPTAEPPRIIYNRQGAALTLPAAPAPGTVVREGEVASNVRVIPRHLYDNYQFALKDTYVPEGYQRVFDDGRLNPHRAVMTFAGKAATDAVWEERLPRRVRADAPSTAVVSTKSTATPPAPVISAKSAPAEKSLRLSGQSYVQVATFSDAIAAQSSARKLRNLGLPAKIGKYQKDGTTYRIVLAGPFADADAASKAESRAKSAGYSGAFVRQ